MKEKGLTEIAQTWLRHIQAIEEGNESAVSYAKKHSLRLQSLYNYKSQFIKKGLLSKSLSCTHKLKFDRVSFKDKYGQETESLIHFPNGITVELKGKNTEHQLIHLLSHWVD